MYRGMNQNQRRELRDVLARIRGERAVLHAAIHNPDLTDEQRLALVRAARGLTDGIDHLDALVGGPRGGKEPWG